MARLLQDFPDDLRVAYRHFPLVSIHDKAALTMQAAEAAGDQGKFWEMHDLLFERQEEWINLSVDQFQEWAVARATELGLNAQRFTSDLTSEENAAKAQEAWDRGVASGMPGTPFILINGRIYNGPLSYGNLSAIVQLLLLEKRQFTSCPVMVVDASKEYIATLHTEKGDIVLELYPDKAPLAVNSFVFLARQGWFDDVTFHRVLPDYIVQAGDPSGTGFGGPGYAFDNEISPDLKFDRPGVLAMANAGAGSNGSQFFITLVPVPDLNGGYTIFGHVLSGMEVVESITPRNPSQGLVLPPGDRITGVTIEEQ
jgi:cyclophilin family peptidyl-prolyl cis-trans isomerase